MQDWHVYLVSCNDNSLYCGITTNIERRLKQHNGLLSGGAKYTRNKRPVTLCMSVLCANRQQASRLEALIKALPKTQKINALQKYNQDNKVLIF